MTQYEFIGYLLVLLFLLALDTLYLRLPAKLLRKKTESNQTVQAIISERKKNVLFYQISGIIFSICIAGIMVFLIIKYISQ